MRKFLILTILNILVLFLSSCTGFAVIRYDGPYEGRVFDADTGEPIEGVVVFGEWSREHITPGGAVSEYYDARETLTDKNGEFSIPGMGLLIASNITPMDVLIFKTGYRYLESTWRGLKVDILLSKKIKWEGSKAIIPLKKLTMEERKKSETFPPYPSTEAPKEKIKLMMEEIYKERKERGLD